MITSDNTLLDSRQNLHYISEHKRVFQVESFYPLDIFENFVQQAKDWGLECSCKIEKDKLYPARFNLFRNHPDFEQFNAVLNLFNQVEAKNGVQLDYRLLHQFLGNDFDPHKLTQILVGVDLRPELLASRLKLWFVMQEYPEKIEKAIALGTLAKEMSPLILESSLVVVGFDFFLNGCSTIEVYPRILKQELQVAVHLQQLLTQLLSPVALELLDKCWAFALGFSKANPETILYCPTPDPDNFIANLRNHLADKVHTYYQKQPIRGTIVAFRERELLAKKVENLNLYYQMTLGVI